MHPTTLSGGESRRLIRILILSVALVGAATSASSQVVVGGDTEPGFIEVRGTAGADQLTLEVDGDVQIGRGGANAADANLIVYDPTSALATEPAFEFNSSQANLSLGSGSAGAVGKDGDLTLEDGTGNAAIRLEGSAADLFLGFNGGDGDLLLTRSNGVETVSLSGNSGALILGGGGTAGDVLVRDGAAVTNFAVDGITGDVTNAFGGEGLAKAWCKVDGDGNLLAGFRCTSATRFVSGVYFVDFTALATDITSRPFLVSCTSQATSGTCQDAQASYSADDLSRIVVTTDTADDGAFTLVIF